jgi:hypothetical protein
MRLGPAVDPAAADAAGDDVRVHEPDLAGQHRDQARPQRGVRVELAEH